MRLIDADALRWAIRENAPKSVPLWVYQTVDEQPTAYDVDEVVQNLVERKRDALDDHVALGMATSLGKAFGLEDAIEIVKAGGKR